MSMNGLIIRVRVALAVVVIAILGLNTGAPKSTSALAVYTYDVRTIGNVSSDLNEFKAHVVQTYADSRGWSAGGKRFLEVPSGIGSNFTLWLASPDTMTSFAAGCDAFYSCRVGRNVIINDDRWRLGSPYLSMGLDNYRHMVVNHETGHWLDLDHWGCPGAGQAAPVMMQQSKGTLDGCTPNPWPTTAELEAVRQAPAAQAGTGLLGYLLTPVKLFP